MSTALRLLVGSGTGRELRLSDGRFVIGRDEACQLRPTSRHVSRRHCELLTTPQGLLVRDLDSRTGTWINGVRLPTQRYLRVEDGDQLQVGPLKFAFCLQAADGHSSAVAELSNNLAASADSSSLSVSADDDVLQWIQEGPTPTSAKQTTAADPTTTIISAAELLAMERPIPESSSLPAADIPVAVPSQLAAEALRNLIRT
ncbi:MAG: FHA domain-containing protein [Pirellulales bacterium]